MRPLFNSTIQKKENDFMKKLSLLLIVLVTFFVLAGCSSSGEEAASDEVKTFENLTFGEFSKFFEETAI